MNNKASYMIYVGLRGEPMERTEAYAVLAPAQVPEHRHLAGVVIETAREGLVAQWGEPAEVRGVVHLASEVCFFDSRLQGFRPIPVVPTERLALMDDHPYDLMLSLMEDERDGLGTGEYLAWLLER